MTILVALTRTSCSICKCKVGANRKYMYWAFKKRLCHICVQECSIVDSALDYAFPGSFLHENLPYENLEILKDLSQKSMHATHCKHYLIDALVEVYGDAITDGYVFEDYKGEGQKDYMNRKFKALEAMRVKAMIRVRRPEVFDEPNVSMSECEEDVEEVYTGKVREKFLEA